MNRLAFFGYCFTIIVLFSFPSPTAAQSTGKITESLHSGSSKELGKFFSNQITLTLNKTQSDYSKNQAELVFRDFFRKHPPEDFKLLHEDESADKSWYFIGKYVSSDSDFRVLVKGTKQNGTYIIESMEFSKE